MLGIVGHDDRLVDEQDRYVVFDAISTSQPWVVQIFGVNQQKRPAVLRTDQDAQQFFVEHDGGLADRQDDAGTREGSRGRSRPRGWAAEHDGCWPLNRHLGLRLQFALIRQCRRQGLD